MNTATKKTPRLARAADPSTFVYAVLEGSICGPTVILAPSLAYGEAATRAGLKTTLVRRSDLGNLAVVLVGDSLVSVSRKDGAAYALAGMFVRYI